jgi:hypothetical protein
MRGLIIMGTSEITYLKDAHIATLFLAFFQIALEISKFFLSGSENRGERYLFLIVRIPIGKMYV